MAKTTLVAVLSLIGGATATTSWSCLSQLEYWENAHWNNLRQTCESGGCPAASGHQSNGCEYYHNGVARGATCDAMARTSNDCTLRGCDGQNNDRCPQNELRAQGTRTTTRAFASGSFDQCKVACQAVTNSYWHGNYINQCQAGCALAHCETTAPSSTPCAYGATTTAAPPTSRPTTPPPTTPSPTNPPTTVAPTPMPSFSPVTSEPTAAPTIRPIVNTVDDCGALHTNCIETTGPLVSSLARCSSDRPRMGNAVCICAGRVHCSHPFSDQRRRGPCGRGDICLVQDETATPSSPPTAAPTRGPTTTPTPAPSVEPSASPSSSVPSAAPSAGPTVSPSGFYEWDAVGRPIFPTDAAGNEQLVVDANGRLVAPVDNRGLPFPPNTFTTTTTITTEAAVSNADESKGGDDGGSSGTIVVVVVIAIILILLVVGGAFLYVKSSAQHPSGATGFSNPAYDEFGGAQQQASATYSEVPAPAGDVNGDVNSYMDVASGATGTTTGYMDVAPDDLEEDV